MSNSDTSVANMGADERATRGVLVFDVNETLLDIESMQEHFHRIFGDTSALRHWFGDVVMYSMTLTLSGLYVDFFTLGRAVLQMLADIRGVDLTVEDGETLARAMRTMPAHPDAAIGLSQLQDDGYRLVTLTNSPHLPEVPSPLETSGLGRFFERQFSVDPSRVFKPSQQLYRDVAAQLGVAPSECMLVAAHAWDTIGAQAAGFRSALITRPGNAPLIADGIPQPTVVAADLLELATRLCVPRRA